MADFSIANEFISRLREAEERRDPSPLESLFTPEAKIDSMTTPNKKPSASAMKTKSRGIVSCGPFQFWKRYLMAFDYVSSHFTNVHETDRVAILEWHSTGRLPMGIPVEYHGVSIIEHDGCHITAFRTYYDSAALLPHANHAMTSYSESVGKPDIRTDATS